MSFNFAALTPSLVATSLATAVLVGVVFGITMYYSGYAVGQFMAGWNSVT